MPREYLLEVNNQIQRVVCEPDTPLLYVLRNDLGLKGVKYGCGSEQCGACKTLIDGQAVPTCKLPAKDVAGLSITTVEGLVQGGELHPLQEAFIREQALQCGFCTPGMIIAAQALLNHQRYPSDEDIRTALETNLCRCGVYDRVRRAIKLRIGRPDQSPKYAVNSDLESLAKFSSFQSPAPLPHTLAENPDLDDWIRLNADGTITLFTGKVELGQGIKTAVALIGAEELDVSLERIKVAVTDTAHSPNEGLTVGSMSLETTGEAMRFAAAEARQVLLSIAFEELEAPIDRLVVADGTIHDPISGRSTTYWDLLAGQAFGRQVTGIGRPKSPDRLTLLGNANPHLDLPDKVSGAQIYIHDLDLPGMVHGRVLRPPHYAARLVSFDESSLKQILGMIRIVQDGSFMGVICEREEEAIKALEQLQKSATWSGELNLPDQASLYEHMLEQPKQSYLVQAGIPVEGAIPQIEIPSEAVHTLKSTYYRPFQMHASLGPSAAVAQLEDEKLTLWVQSQGVYPIRDAVAHVLGMSENDVRVIHVEGAGCYGHNGADDAALDAALLARAYPGRPISLKWMRADEHTWEPNGPAMMMKMQASLGDDGQVIAWNHDVWSYPHLGRSYARDHTSGLLAAWHLAEPFAQGTPNPELAPHVGSHRNADPLYNFPNRRIVKHFIPESPLRVSALRGLGAFGNVFAIESFVDELAYRAGTDPLDFRLRHLEDERAIAVINAVAEKADWRSSGTEEIDGHGRGLAFAQYKNRQCYAAVIVDLKVDRNNGEIKLERVVIAADAGQIVSANGLSNQLEGSFVQAASWTLLEQVNFNHQGITSQDWDSYPILRFPQSPKVETVLINRPGLPFLGSGEAAQGPTPAAIANAIFDAAGIRLREVPFTPERVRDALNEKIL
jgi:CO/xanthine dehydrogenase Mo-binding subunit/aerobic-type carbon monoxide dehydrogenase small subunit (CoxS/CutS family)